MAKINKVVSRIYEEIQECETSYQNLLDGGYGKRHLEYLDGEIAGLHKSLLIIAGIFKEKLK